MAFSTNTTVKLHYIITRKSSDEVSSSKKIVLIHGLFFGNLAGWFPLIANRLSELSDVLCYDLRGHGLSEVVTSSYFMQDHLKDLQELLDEIGWWKEPLLFIGHSYGARLALAMAVARQYSADYSSFSKLIQNYQELDHESIMHPAPCLDQVILIDPPLHPRSNLSNDHDKIAYEQLFEHDFETIKSWLPSNLKLLLSSKGRQVRRLLKRWQKLLEESTFAEDMKSFQPVSEAELRVLSTVGSILFGKSSGCIHDIHLVEDKLAQNQISTVNHGHFLLNECPDKVLEFIVKCWQGEAN